MWPWTGNIVHYSDFFAVSFDSPLNDVNLSRDFNNSKVYIMIYAPKNVCKQNASCGGIDRGNRPTRRRVESSRLSVRARPPCAYYRCLCTMNLLWRLALGTPLNRWPACLPHMHIRPVSRTWCTWSCDAQGGPIDKNDFGRIDGGCSGGGGGCCSPLRTHDVTTTDQLWISPADATWSSSSTSPRDSHARHHHSVCILSNFLYPEDSSMLQK